MKEDTWHLWAVVVVLWVIAMASVISGNIGLFALSGGICLLITGWLMRGLLEYPDDSLKAFLDAVGLRKDDKPKFPPTLKEIWYEQDKAARK